MKKIFMAMVLFIMVSLFSSVSAYAAQDEFKVDTATHINLMGKDRFAVDLQSNELIFANEPLSKDYEEMWLEVRKGKGYSQSDTVLKVTYARGQGDGTKIDLKGLADGTYSLYIGYVFYGDYTEDYEGDDFGFYEDEDYVKEDNEAYAFPNYDRYNFSIVVKGGKSSFKLIESFISNTKIAAKEKTDEYAQDFYKNKGDLDYFKKTGILKQANSIVAGITDDYEKVKAIQTWVYNNIDYDAKAAYFGGDLRYLSAAEVLTGKITVCEGYANLTVALMQAAGFPAKKITGDASGPAIRINNDGSHAWTEVYVDNRWVFMDSTWGDDWFDVPIIRYSEDHLRDDLGAYDPDNDINDSLYFYDSKNNIMLKEVKKFPFNGIVNSTYGFDIKDLYFDTDSKKPFMLGTMKVDSSNGVIYVDYCRGKEPYSVIFSIVDNDGYGLDYDDETYCNYGNNKPAASMWYYFTPANAKLTKPKDPVRKGYTFLGWYNSDTGKKWNFATDKVTSKFDGMRLVSRWEKTASTVTKYKVTFNANNGVSPKTLTITKGSKISEPDTPSPRTGYKFTGWYKDSKCTQAWDFSKDKVTANIALYAGWKKI